MLNIYENLTVMTVSHVFDAVYFHGIPVPMFKYFLAEHSGVHVGPTITIVDHRHDSFGFVMVYAYDEHTLWCFLEEFVSIEYVLGRLHAQASFGSLV